MRQESEIAGWHAHVYFEKPERAAAETLCRAAAKRFGLEMGRMHDDPIGPHPVGSCQLSVPPDRIGAVIGWLALNRSGLSVFTHAETGDVIADHTEHVVWLGESRALRLDVLHRLVDGREGR